jgi:hypothetical protein
MTVPVLRYGSETWTKKKNEKEREKAKLKTAKMKFLRNGGGYTRNTSNKIKIAVEISCSTNGSYTKSKENFNVQPNKMMKHEEPTDKMEEPTSRGRHRPHTA